MIDTGAWAIHVGLILYWHLLLLHATNKAKAKSSLDLCANVPVVISLDCLPQSSASIRFAPFCPVSCPCQPVRQVSTISLLLSLCLGNAITCTFICLCTVPCGWLMKERQIFQQSIYFTLSPEYFNTGTAMFTLRSDLPGPIQFWPSSCRAYHLHRLGR